MTKLEQQNLLGEPDVVEQPPVGCDRRWLNPEQTAYLWAHCLKLSWKRYSLRGTQLPRLNAAYTNMVGGMMTYSGETVVPLQMDRVLNRITAKVNDYLGLEFNSIILNWYKEPNHHIGWHRDNILECGLDCAVASLSLGDSRVFQLRKGRDGKIFSYVLSDGDLLLMAPGCQRDWYHRITAARRSPGEPQNQGRISLTFRQIRKKSIVSTVTETSTVETVPSQHHHQLAQRVKSQLPSFRHKESGAIGHQCSVAGNIKILCNGQLYSMIYGFGKRSPKT